MAKNTTYISTIKLDFRFFKKACGEKCYTTAQYNLRFQSVRVGEGRRRVMRKTNHISANQYKRLTKKRPSLPLLMKLVESAYPLPITHSLTI